MQRRLEQIDESNYPGVLNGRLAEFSAQKAAREARRAKLAPRSPCLRQRTRRGLPLGAKDPRNYLPRQHVPLAQDAEGGRSSAISRRMSANSFRGMATSAIWNAT